MIAITQSSMEPSGSQKQSRPSSNSGDADQQRVSGPTADYENGVLDEALHKRRFVTFISDSPAGPDRDDQ